MMEFIGILTGGTVVAGLVVWAAKLIIAKAIDTGGKVFENKLEKELEIHKKNLDMMKIQYQIQYSSLHERRGEIISELYSLLYVLEQDLLYYTTTYQGAEWIEDRERDKKAAETLTQCKDLFEKNRIYFKQELCDKLDKIFFEREDVISKMRAAKSKAKQLERIKFDIERKARYNEGETADDIWIEQERKVQGDISDSRKQLADEFRVLFGIEIKSDE